MSNMKNIDHTSAQQPAVVSGATTISSVEFLVQKPPEC